MCNCFLLLPPPAILGNSSSRPLFSYFPLTSSPFHRLPSSCPSPQLNWLVLPVSKLFKEGASPLLFTPGELPCKLFSINCPIPEWTQWAWVQSVMHALYLKEALIRQFTKYTPWKRHKICKISSNRDGNDSIINHVCELQKWNQMKIWSSQSWTQL